MKKKIIYSLMSLFLFTVGTLLTIHQYDTIKKGAFEHVELKAFTEDMIPTYQRYILALAGDIYEGITVNPDDRELYLRYVEDYKEALQQAPIKYYAYNQVTLQIETNFDSINFDAMLEDSSYYSVIKIEYPKNSYPIITEGGIESEFERSIIEGRLHQTFKSQGRMITDKMDALTIQNCTFIFAVEKEDIAYFMSYYFYENSPYILYYFIGILVVGALLTLIYTSLLKVDVLKELQPYRLFKHVYLEILIILIFMMVVTSGIAAAFLGIITMSQRINALLLEWNLSEMLIIPIHLIVWFIYYYSVSLLMFIVKYIANMKVTVYLKKHTLTAIGLNWLKKLILLIKKGIKKIIKGIDYLLTIDFHDHHNRSLILIILMSAIVMIYACAWQSFHISVLIVVGYLFALFIFLNKKLTKFKKNYELLLQSTHSISKGDFDIDIQQGLDYLNPLKEELSHIRDGFKKAVEEEVKSQKMKTELITNVSHDLKTPLTSIMTYIDLLKDEKLDESTRVSYLQTLDRNALRLKQLIEDLFEISKANSGNVSLNTMDVDLGSLILQTYYECKDALDENKIDVRFTNLDEKHICCLDSAKTYRIFENLFINISKYALPCTRAYIVLEDYQEEIKITFKNISKDEMNFDVDEITERFVQGDSSRNSSGSGLGLAIVKSFTELQKGLFRIETDGDLFKAILVFKK